MGENSFRVRVYRNVARIVSGLSENVTDLIDRGEDLTALGGIGKDLAEKIEEIARSGHLEVLDALKETMPGELVQIMGWGVKERPLSTPLLG